MGGVKPLMRAAAMPLTAASLAVAGCGEERVSGDEVLTRAETLENPRPGLYETTTELVSYELPGANPQEADRQRTQAQNIGKQTGQQCVTEEQSEAGFEKLLEDIVTGINSMDCGFSNFEASAPRINATLQCDGPLDAKAGVTFAGTTDSEGYDLTMDLGASSRLIAGGSMEMRMKFTSRRIGECEAGVAGGTDTGPAQ